MLGNVLLPEQVENAYFHQTHNLIPTTLKVSMLG